MTKKIKTKKFKNLKEFLETCSDDEREYIYDLYNNASVADLIDLLFEHLPADETIKEIQEYIPKTYHNIFFFCDNFFANIL